MTNTIGAQWKTNCATTNGFAPPRESVEPAAVRSPAPLFCCLASLGNEPDPT